MMEGLEVRQLAASTAPSFAERGLTALSVQGSEANDVFELRPDNAGNVVVRRYPNGQPNNALVFTTTLNQLTSINVNGGGGTDEVRVDFSLHTNTHTRSVESRRVYIKSGTRLTGEYSITPLEGVVAGSVRRWLARSKAQIDAVPADQKTAARVLFLGDSMAERFLTTGLSSWDRQLVPRNAVNLGLTGDTTSNLLYRIETGLLNGYAPKVIVLAIGANNIDRTDNVNSTLSGIRAVTRAIASRLPSTKILIASIFPRRIEFENNRAVSINQRLSTWDDGRALRFFDVYAHFAASPVREDLYRPNDIHLNSKGYRLWANLLVARLDSLLAE